MNSRRLYFVLIGMIGLLFVGLLAGAYGTNSLLTARAEHLTSLKAKSQALDQEQRSLADAQTEVKNYAGLAQIAKSVVPEDKDQAEAVREIVNIAAANGISLASVTFPASTLGNGSGSVGANVGSPSQVGAPAAASPKTSASAGKLSQLQPVKNIPGVYVLQITVQGDTNKPVPYSSFINFLSALEHNRRTAQLSSITLQPNANNPNLLNFTLTLNEYIKP